eukprot:gene41449-50577_t
MWFNSKQRAEPYQLLTSVGLRRDALVPARERQDRGTAGDKPEEGGDDV